MKPQSRDTQPDAEKVQIELLRQAGSSGRAELAMALSQRMHELSRQAIRRRHPRWTEQEVRLHFAALHYGAQLAERIRSELEKRNEPV